MSAPMVISPSAAALATVEGIQGGDIKAGGRLKITGTGASLLEGLGLGAITGSRSKSQLLFGIFGSPPTFPKKIKALESISSFASFEELRSTVPIKERKKLAKKLKKFGAFTEASGLTKFQVKQLLVPEKFGTFIPGPGPAPPVRVAPQPSVPVSVPPITSRVVQSVVNVPSLQEAGGFPMPFVNTSPRFGAGFVAGAPTIEGGGFDLGGLLRTGVSLATSIFGQRAPDRNGGIPERLGIGGNVIQRAAERILFPTEERPVPIVQPTSMPGGAPIVRAPAVPGGGPCPTLFKARDTVIARPVNRFTVLNPVSGAPVFYGRLIPTGFRLAGKRRSCRRPR